MTARRATAQVDHHFLDGNDDAETLVVHHGHRLTVVQLLDAAQLARQNTAGTVGVVNLMPDDILTVFRRLFGNIRKSMPPKSVSVQEKNTGMPYGN